MLNSNTELFDLALDSNICGVSDSNLHAIGMEIRDIL